MQKWQIFQKIDKNTQKVKKTKFPNFFKLISYVTIQNFRPNGFIQFQKKILKNLKYWNVF